MKEQAYNFEGTKPIDFKNPIDVFIALAGLILFCMAWSIYFLFYDGKLNKMEAEK